MRLQNRYDGRVIVLVADNQKHGTFYFAENFFADRLIVPEIHVIIAKILPILRLGTNFFLLLNKLRIKFCKFVNLQSARRKKSRFQSSRAYRCNSFNFFGIHCREFVRTVCPVAESQNLNRLIGDFFNDRQNIRRFLLISQRRMSCF